MAPEPTEAMVEAGAKTAFESAAGPSAWDVQDEGHKEIAMQDFEAGLLAAFAAAPPEWFLRAALEERELALIWESMRITDAVRGQLTDPPSPLWEETQAAVSQKLFRALRGGEEP